MRCCLMLSVVLVLFGCGSAEEASPHSRTNEGAPAEEPVPRFAAVISAPPVLEGLVATGANVATEEGVIPCATCHDAAVRDNPPLPASAEGIEGPHAGLRVAHGAISCASCHDARDRSALHLADGTSVPLVEAMQLCRQCHGPQARDYDHGSHGGMRGHWDLSRGPRQRNHCVDCHDPHAPAFGSFLPLPPPRDRFSTEGEPSHD